MDPLSAASQGVAIVTAAVWHDAGDVTKWVVLCIVVAVIAFLVARDLAIRSLRAVVAAMQESVTNLAAASERHERIIKRQGRLLRRRGCERAPDCDRFVPLTDDMMGEDDEPPVLKVGGTD